MFIIFNKKQIKDEVKEEISSGKCNNLNHASNKKTVANTGQVLEQFRKDIKSIVDGKHLQSSPIDERLSPQLYLNKKT